MQTATALEGQNGVMPFANLQVGEIQEWIISTLERIYKIRFEYRKARIILSCLVPSEQLTKRIFDDERFQQ